MVSSYKAPDRIRDRMRDMTPRPMAPHFRSTNTHLRQHHTSPRDKETLGTVHTAVTARPEGIY